MNQVKNGWIRNQEFERAHKVAITVHFKDLPQQFPIGTKENHKTQAQPVSHSNITLYLVPYGDKVAQYISHCIWVIH